AVGENAVVAAKLIHLLARLHADDRGADQLDRQTLHLVEPADLARAAPAFEVALHRLLDDRQIRRDRRARERLQHRALPSRMQIAVEQRKTAAAEQLLHVRRHRTFAHDDADVDETSDRVDPRDDGGLPAEDVGAEDATVNGDALLDEAEWILREGECLAEKGE